MLDDAATEQDVRVPPGNHFEKLSGHLHGCHSIRVNRRGGWCSVGMAAEGMRRTCISTITAIGEVLPW